MLRHVHRLAAAPSGPDSQFDCDFPPSAWCWPIVRQVSCSMNVAGLTVGRETGSFCGRGVCISMQCRPPTSLRSCFN
jgi:hypothetical protein